MKVNREWRSKQTTKKKMDEVEKEEIQLDMEDQEGEESEETCSAQGENPMVITGDTRPNSKEQEEKEKQNDWQEATKNKNKKRIPTKSN